MTGAGGATWESTVSSLMSSPAIKIASRCRHAGNEERALNSDTAGHGPSPLGLAFEDNDVVCVRAGHNLWAVPSAAFGAVGAHVLERDAALLHGD